MKWFSKNPVPRDPTERVIACLEYLNRLEKMPERTATFRILEETVRDNEFEGSLYNKIVRVNYAPINFRLGIFGPPDAVDALLEMKELTQELVSNILQNKRLLEKQLEAVDKVIDDSPKGRVNRLAYGRLRET